MKFRSETFLVFLFFAFAIALTGCGSSGGGGGGGGKSTCAAPICNALTGSVWSVAGTIGANTCGDSGDEYYNFTITSQDGSSVILHDDTNGGTYNAKFCGDKMTGSASYPDNFGTTTSNVTLTFSSCTAFTGNSKWSWHDSSSSCSGTTYLAGGRN